MEGKLAPDFKLPDQDGIYHSLSDYERKWVVLYFYPKDDTPGCTTEACNFRDSFHKLENSGVQIIGISKDTVESHKKFATKYGLNFPILSDIDHKVIENYNAWGIKKLMGREFEGIIRKTYLIDPARIIKKVYEKVNPLIHATEITNDLSKYRK